MADPLQRVRRQRRAGAPFDVNRWAWLEKYADNIRGFVETDCIDPKSITLLKRRIQEQIGQLKDVKTKFPARWFAIKDELRQASRRRSRD